MTTSTTTPATITSSTNSISTTNASTQCKLSTGECDHECHIIEDIDNENRVECSCYNGFVLDEHDGRTCHGKYV